jgi:autotransporter-associated beta strand protein
VASPSTAVHNQNVLISVTVTNGSGTVDPNTGVVLNASTIGGSSSVNLVLSGTPNVYTNTITVPTSPAAGNYVLTAQITDSNSQIGTANIALNVTTTEVWNGGGSDQNWDTSLNWVSGVAPDLSGDSLVFAGGTPGSEPNMDNSYSVTGLTFSNNATSFTIVSTTGSTLTLAGSGVTNNSANAQTLNVPLVEMGAPQTFNAASGNISVSGVVDDAGAGLALTKTGNNVMVLSGTNTYSGNTIINAGNLTIGGAGQLEAGAYAAAMVDNGTFAYNSSAQQVLSGVISGSGALTQSGPGVLVLDNASNTFSGNITVNGYLVATNDSYFAIDNATQGPLGNPATPGRTITVNNGGTLVFGIGNVFGGGGSTNPLAVSLVINQGGTVKTAASTNVNGLFPGNGGGDANSFGNIILNGGTFSTGNGYANSPDYQAAILLGSVTVGGSSASTINSVASNANANGLMLGKQGGGTVTFNVAATGAGGADLIVTAPLVNAPNNTTGALLKTGSGTLQLDAANTYAGSTTVSNGTLVGIGSIGGPVVVAPAGTIGAGDAGASVGTLTIYNNLTLQGVARMRISKTGGTLTSDLITGLSTVTYGGSLVVSNLTSDTNLLAAGDTFTLFSAATQVSNFASIVGSPGTGLVYSFTNGVLSVVSTGPSGPAQLASRVMGGTLSLAWPSGQGWRLVSQTNSLSTGLNPNSAAWGTVPGVSDGSASLTIDPTKPAVFYRLVYP